MVQLSYVDPKLLKPSSGQLLSGEDPSLIDKFVSFFRSTPESDAPAKSAQVTQTSSTNTMVLPPIVLSGSDEITVDAAAETLYALHEQMARLWPAMKEKAQRGELSQAQMAVWNGAQWNLIDLELKLARRLVELGVQDSNGKPLRTPTVADLQQRLQIGRFAGIPNATLGIVQLPLTLLIVAIFGTTVAGAGLIYAGAQFVKSFKAVDIEKAKVAGAIVDCVASGKCSEETLIRLKDLKLQQDDDSKLPGWAKAVIAVGAVAGGLILIVNVVPAIKRWRTA